MNRIKAAAIAAVTAALLFGLSIWALALPDRDVSQAERRTLAQAPAVSAKSVFSGRYMKDLETYFLDQFPVRDSWRALQTAIRLGLLRQKDTNGIYLAGDSVVKLEYPLDEAQLGHAAKKIREVCDTYLQGMNIRLAVVPDKSYFAAEAGGYPHMDYEAMVRRLREETGLAYVDLFPQLTLEDYYRTDAHWRQERIFPVAQTLADALGLGVSLTPEAGFARETLSPFYGVYYGQSALPVAPDTLTYLRSPAIDAAVLRSIELEGDWPVYTLEKFSGMDGYDVFAAGPQAIVTLESPNARTDRELIVFRDSFGSSLAPLFLEGYRKVTLIDLRYVAAKLLDRFVEFQDQDVLFLYSTTLLNSGMLLK